MSWVKGDRLKITLEVIAEEPSDETADIWFPAGRSRDWINPTDIEEAGGTVTVEVLPKPVELPSKKWAQIIVEDALGLEELLTLDRTMQWFTIWGDKVSEQDVRKMYIRTLSEGVDE